MAEGAQLTLLHVISSGLALREQRIAEREATQLLSEEARHLGASLPKDVRIESVVKTGGAAREIIELARAQASDMITMGRGGGRVLRDAFLGSTAERVMRTAKLPVLAV